tara:strand:+ start:120 stop:860 length:741 start_codon:yes stop_codon:yes gene_type:complete
MNPEIVINICEDKLQFDKNTKRNFRQYIRKNNQKHLLTQLAYQYADFVMNNNNTQNIGEIKQDVPVIQVDHKLQEKYDNLLKENEKLKETIKSHKTNKELEEKYEKLQKSKDRIRKQYIQRIDELEKHVNDYKNKYEKEDTIIDTDDVSSLKKIINMLKIDNQDLKTQISIKSKSGFESDDDDDIEELRKENKQLRIDMSIAKRIPDFHNELQKAKDRYYKESDLRKSRPLKTERVDPLDEEFEDH